MPSAWELVRGPSHDPDKIRMASQLVKESVAAIARWLGVNRACLYASVPEVHGGTAQPYPPARLADFTPDLATPKTR
jgi:hypothetical protein